MKLRSRPSISRCQNLQRKRPRLGDSYVISNEMENNLINQSPRQPLEDKRKQEPFRRSQPRELNPRPFDRDTSIKSVQASHRVPTALITRPFRQFRSGATSQPKGTAVRYNLCISKCRGGMYYRSSGTMGTSTALRLHYGLYYTNHARAAGVF